MWQLRPQGLRLLGGKRFLQMEVFTSSPLLLKFRLGRLSLTLTKPRIAVCEQETAQFPRPLGHISLSPPGREMLLFQKAFVTSLEWGIWDNGLG